MENTFIGYIFPNEPLLLAIIVGIWVVAGVVAYKIHKLRQIAKVNLKALENTADVASLEQSLKNPRSNHDEVFTLYARDKGIEPRTEILFDHINTIFKAGVKGSNLEPELLVQNTVAKMFSGIDSLKTSVSMFLVIGILGTLLGLAISIGSFSGGNFLVNQGTAATAGQLTELFKNLRGAFAPSMWGVANTIFFVFVYTFAVQDGCINKVTEKLTLNTIQHWLPSLYPTDFQRGDNSIAKLNATIKNADGINKEVIELQNNLKASNETIRALSKMSRQVELATTHFEVGTNKIGEIQKIYEDLRKCNDAFNESIEAITTTAETASKENYSKYLVQSQEQAAKLQDKVNQLTEQMNVYFAQLTEAMKAQTSGLADEAKSQQSKLEAIIKELQRYNEGILKSVNKLMEVANKTIENSNNANEILQKSAQLFISSKDEMVAAIAGPVERSLGEMTASINKQLDTMTKSINAQLDGVSKSLSRMGVPLTAVAESMNKSFNRMIKELRDQSMRMEHVSQMLVSSTSSGKIDPAMLKSWIQQPQSTSFSSQEIESGLQDILKQLQNMESQNQLYVKMIEEIKGKTDKPVTVWEKYHLTLPNVTISVLLLLIFIMQSIMVYHLSTLK